jgi:hypothetical protein
LADRIMVVLAGCSMASPKQCLSKLVSDPGLPADIRMDVAQIAFPDRTSGVRRARRAKSGRPLETLSQAARDALLGIVSDASASAKARRKAAAKLAAYFLPKKPVNKRWQFTADECGFAINAEIAREHRAIDFELRALQHNSNRHFPEIAQIISKLRARIDAIRQRLQCPCPTRYGNKVISEDMIRLNTLADKREAGITLTPEEDAEEAHRDARLNCYLEGPEQTARRRRQHLEAADNLFRKSRFFNDGMTAPLPRKEGSDLALLRWLYPSHNSKIGRYLELEAQADATLAIGHPFHDEAPAADDHFYPQGSKLRPASADESKFIEYTSDVPPFCVLTPGQPLPISFSSGKSERAQS